MSFPVDHHWRGAFMVGPPMLTDEEARRLRDNRTLVEHRLAESFALLREKLAALPPEPEPSLDDEE